MSVLDRKYSVEEITRMRSAVERGTGAGDRLAIEAILLTYMLNGTSPEELEAWAEIAWQET